MRKHLLRKRGVIVALAAMMTLPLTAQKTHTVSGYVTDGVSSMRHLYARNYKRKTLKN